MMRTLYEVKNYMDIGDAESGPIVREGTDYFKAEVNLFQPMEEIFKEVLRQYMEYTADWGCIGAEVVRLIPNKDAEEIEKDMCLEDEYAESYQDYISSYIY